MAEASDCTVPGSLPTIKAETESLEEEEAASPEGQEIEENHDKRHRLFVVPTSNHFQPHVC